MYLKQPEAYQYTHSQDASECGTEENNALHKTFVFKNFAEAMAWMIKVSYTIEKLDHHPEWTNIYNRVEVKLTTHDKGNRITEKDRQLAEALDALV